MSKTGNNRAPLYDACLGCWETCNVAGLDWGVLVPKVNTDTLEKDRFLHMRAVHKGEAKRKFTGEDVDKIEYHGMKVQMRAPLWTEAQIKERCGVDPGRLSVPWVQIWDCEGKAMKALPVLDTTQPMYEMVVFYTKGNRLDRVEASSSSQLREEQSREVFTKLNKELLKKGVSPSSFLTLDKVDNLADILKAADRRALLGQQEETPKKREKRDGDEGDEDDEDDDSDGGEDFEVEIAGQTKGAGKAKGSGKKGGRGTPRKPVGSKACGAAPRKGASRLRTGPPRSEADSASQVGLDTIEDMGNGDGTETAQRWIDKLDIDAILARQLEKPRLQLHHALRCKGTFAKHGKIGAKALLGDHLVVAECATELVENIGALDPLRRARCVATCVQAGASLPDDMCVALARLAGMEAMEGGEPDAAVFASCPFGADDMAEESFEPKKPQGQVLCEFMFRSTEKPANMSTADHAASLETKAQLVSTMMLEVFLGDALLANIGMQEVTAQQQLANSTVIAEAFTYDTEKFAWLPEPIRNTADMIKTAHKTLVALLHPLPMPELTDFVEATFSEKRLRSPLKILASVIMEDGEGLGKSFYSRRYADYGRYAVSMAELSPQVTAVIEQLKGADIHKSSASLSAAIQLLPELTEKSRAGGAEVLEKEIFAALQGRYKALREEMASSSGTRTMEAAAFSTFIKDTQMYMDKFRERATCEKMLDELEEMRMNEEDMMTSALQQAQLDVFSDACQAVGIEASDINIDNIVGAVKKLEATLPAKNCIGANQACTALLAAWTVAAEAGERASTKKLSGAAGDIAALLGKVDAAGSKDLKMGCDVLRLGAECAEAVEKYTEAKPKKSSKDLKRALDKLVETQKACAMLMAKLSSEDSGQALVVALGRAMSVDVKYVKQAVESMTCLAKLLDEVRAEAVVEHLRKVEVISADLQNLAGGVAGDSWKDGLADKCNWTEMKERATQDGGILGADPDILSNMFKTAKEAT